MTIRRIPALGGGTIEVMPRIWDHFYKEAIEEKAWAARVKDDAEWLANASIMSKESLAKALKKSLDELATYAVQYTYYRANLSYGYKNQNAIDPAARAEWLGLGGKLEER